MNAFRVAIAEMVNRRSPVPCNDAQRRSASARRSTAQQARHEGADGPSLDSRMLDSRDRGEALTGLMNRRLEKRTQEEIVVRVCRPRKVPVRTDGGRTAERGTSLGCVFFIRQAIVRQALFTRPARCSSALEGAGSGKEACAWALSAGSSWG